ncbi:MAG TPA: response regulator [Nitrososphaeraceae archaeon]|nr:response regulator [Nitrososphaeraceae archaeon]
MTKKWLVAIVDDELDIVNLFRDCLSGINEILIFTFTDPLIALEHIITNKDTYFLIISDLRMPTLCGIEFLKKVKTENPLVRTLLMTAFELDDELFQEYMKADIINDLLQKPIRLEDLRSTVINHLISYKRNLKD